MKYTTVALALAATVLAQDSPSTGVPSCAQDCITQATIGNKIAGCTTGDIKCVCSNDSFLSSIACCLADACDKDGQSQAVNFARSICTGAGVSVPGEVVCNQSASSTGSQTGTQTSETQSSTATGTADENQPTESGSSGGDGGDNSGGDGNGAVGNVASVVAAFSGALVVAMALL
ncbi:uncharacterized protein DNG_00675 [Cephalotrichum gorgonifer]|uniref:CFEM domain-containing protein n=1 Tax=Cephalotrichum gorgonifer TaxID=2041049 RepID=A0AAE8MQD1_9PEZI|nr:uncharacterized protein DNG_00675 [Cephalotrichum gorgonifer]